MTTQISYYAVIPANVRYDKDLSPNAKLLYGEITALCNKHGYCWAENKYFAELYGVSKSSITKWIGLLVKKGYIQTTITYKEKSKEIDKRYITLPGSDPPSKNLLYPPEKSAIPVVKIYEDNNNTSEYYYHGYHNARAHARNKEDDWNKIVKITGIEYHSPTAKEKKFVDRWLNEWSFTDDMIREAYERCVDSTGRCNFSYMDKILEKWHITGVSTLDQASTESQKKKRQKSQNTASYDIEEYENYDMFGDMGGDIDDEPIPHQKE